MYFRRIIGALCVALLIGLSASMAFAAPMPKVKVDTSMGSFVLELNQAKAPKTVSNFLFYVKSGFYTDTIFHRIISGFMVQGGGFTEAMQQKKTRDPIKNEASSALKNDMYTIAMARTNNPHSATAQFFINVAKNSSLDFRAPTAQGYGYAVFGKVIEGKDVIDRMKAVPTGSARGMGDVPKTPIIIKSMTLLP